MVVRTDALKTVAELRLQLFDRLYNLLKYSDSVQSL